MSTLIGIACLLDVQPVSRRGVVPGVLILKPDFPEHMEDWPFLWGENEYVVDTCAQYIFLAQAARDLLAK